MSIFEKILGGGAKGILDGMTGLIDEIFTSQEEKDTAKLLLLEAEQRGLFEQTKINAIEANHRSVFVAGWRPFIGWICGSILLYHWFLIHFIAWTITAFFPEVPQPPELDTGEIIALLTAMLGIAGYRTYEKKNKVTDQ